MILGRGFARAGRGPVPLAKPRLARQRVAAPLGVALVVAVLLALVAPPAGLVPAPTAQAADTDLTLVTDASYDVQPAKGVVRVAVAIVARNHKGETRTHRYYFDRAYLAVQPGTSAFRISGAKGAKVRVARRTATYTLLRIDFGARLYGGGSRTYHLSFSLKDPGGAANRQVRVGRSLVSLPVWAYASTGATGSRVTVSLPAGYDVAVESGSFSRRERTTAGGTRLSTGPLSKPLSFFAYVVAQQPAAYVDSALNVKVADGTVPLTMRAWTDDRGWAKRVGAVFAKSLPVLRTAIGLAWPHSDPMVVQEAVSRTSGGYAGLFDPTGQRIEVAYWAGHLVMLHEAAHGWFNGALLADRWADEGFASLYAQRAAAVLKEKGASPKLTAAVKAAHIPLNAWAQSAAGADPATEAYGYAASLALAQAIATRAGDDALRQVWADAAAGVGAYQPVAASDGQGTTGTAGTAPTAATALTTATGTTPETVAGAPDWRGLLDLLEARTGKDFTDLWRTWVIRPEESTLLDARAASRTAYSRTLALANGWAMPRSIRDALRAWQFEAADGLMADARTVLAQRGAVEARAARAAIPLPATMRTLFEAGDLVGASREAEAELNAIEVIDGAAAARSADSDPLTAVGMLGGNPGADLARARSSFEAGNLDASLDAANDAYSGWNGAWQEGRRRVLFAVAVLATILVLTWAILGTVRRSRRPHAKVPSMAHPVRRPGSRR